jgi:dihydroorotate dehydrogenase electron transfer subunit
LSAQPAEGGPTGAGFVEVEGDVVANALLPGTRLWWLELAVPAECFPAPDPGQFAMLAAPGAEAAELVLSRPFSIARAWDDGASRRLGFLYTRVGRGTDLMTRSVTGAFRVLGPLGRGFPRAGKGPALLVGGGRGTAPLVILAEALEAAGRDVHFLVGARGRADFAGPAEMGARLSRTRVWEASEDGSRGHRGRVLDLFEREPALATALGAEGAELFACGPHGLLAAVQRLGAARGVPVHASVEAHMACGTGICRSCVVPRAAAVPAAVARASSRGRNPEFLLACLDGPVVPGSAVDWARDRETIVSPAFAAGERS